MPERLYMTVSDDVKRERITDGIRSRYYTDFRKGRYCFYPHGGVPTHILRDAIDPNTAKPVMYLLCGQTGIEGLHQGYWTSYIGAFLNREDAERVRQLLMDKRADIERRGLYESPAIKYGGLYYNSDYNIGSYFIVPIRHMYDDSTDITGGA